MNSKCQRTLAIVEDDMADVADAKLAVRVLWQRLAHIARRGRITIKDIDCFSDELRCVERGLEASTKWLIWQREHENGNGDD